jgi:hypothetical protein
MTMLTNLQHCLLTKIAPNWLQDNYDAGFDRGQIQRSREEDQLRGDPDWDDDYESTPIFTPKAMGQMDHNETTWMGFYGFCDGYSGKEKRDYQIV